MIQWINIILFFSCFSFGYNHPVHVSVSNIEYSKDLNKMNISIKIFEDDFRLLFFHLNQVEVDLKVESNYDKYKDLIISYFKNHFKLKANNKEDLEITIKRWKINEDAIWFYMETSLKNEIKTLKVSNSLLLDLYFDQKNLVILKTLDKELGLQFDYKTTEKVIILNK